MHTLPALLTALPTASAVGGWWLIAGLVVAGAFAALFTGTGRRRAVPHPVLRVAVWGLLAAVAARAFAAVVFPQYDSLAAAVVIVVTGGGVILGLAAPPASRRAASAVLLLGAASFAAICATVDPPPTVVPVPADDTSAASSFAVAGLFVAPMLVLDPAGSARRGLARVAAAVVATCAVAAGALYQLGPQRLAVSDAPLHDALAAADAAVLTTMLEAFVVVGTLTAVLVALASARRAASAGPRPRILVGAVVAGAVVLASTVDPVVVLAAASVVAVTSSVLGWVQAGQDGGRQNGK
ncbi:hypothetical protein [Thermocrispum agreste]|uniref:Uncharacterized protein n=1 Tax=Thermocrispum agreste TaxID=37925 RepID=A0A2W4JIM9_9PSEU|nr:hypothetical protein [Thermocrispum agreste]PZM98321.1 MAG: hypothetical protein DIU77_08085 [Thermocrispum agreste]